MADRPHGSQSPDGGFTTAGDPSMDSSAVPSSVVAPASTEPPLVSEASVEPAASPFQSLGRGLRRLGTGLLGLGLLAGAGGLGWIAGMGVAQVIPAAVPVPPRSEVLRRQGAHALGKLRQFSQWWQQDSLGPGQLSVGQLQRTLDQLEADISALETTQGVAPAGSMQERLRQLAATQPTAIPVATDRGQAVDSRIVLPSSLLFEAGTASLTPRGEQLLDAIVADLQRYPQATFMVGSHSAVTANPALARDLTFQQAATVQRHLRSQVGSEGRWVIVGYGQTRPNSGDAALDQRLEIAILARPAL